jgi:hypothetical protein
MDQALLRTDLTFQFAAQGRALVKEEYDTNVLGGRVKKLYQELIEKKQ